MSVGAESTLRQLAETVRPRLRVHVLRPDIVRAPQYASMDAAGLDLQAALDSPLELPAGGYAQVPTGIAMAIPPGYEGQVRPRSGLAAKFGVTLLNTPGTVDADYRGEICVIMINHGKKAYHVQPGDRIAQLVIAPVVQVEVVAVAEAQDLGSTSRGTGGFGSTGR